MTRPHLLAFTLTAALVTVAAAAPSWGKGKAAKVEPKAPLCDKVEDCTKLCDGGNAAACTVLGERITSADYPGMKAAYEKACNGGHAAGCGKLAWMHRDGRATAKDATKANELYTKACDGGDGSSCEEIAGNATDKAEAKKLYLKASAAYEKECGDGAPTGCQGASDLYEKGLGVGKSRPNMIKWRKKGCSLGDEQQCAGYNGGASGY